MAGDSRSQRPIIDDDIGFREDKEFIPECLCLDSMTRLKDAVKRVGAKMTPNQYRDAIKNAIFTAPENWPAETAKKLEAIIGKYAAK